jgi:hypothetical protein
MYMLVFLFFLVARLPSSHDGNCGLSNERLSYEEHPRIPESFDVSEVACMHRGTSFAYTESESGEMVRHFN